LKLTDPLSFDGLAQRKQASIFRELEHWGDRMSLELDDLSARLLAIEAIVGHLVVHLAVRDEDPPRWLATRKALALHAAHSFAQDGAADALAHAMSDAIATFFDDVQRAVCAGAVRT
jgi:hypothetical protein